PPRSPPRDYFPWPVPPCSSSFFLMSSASALVTFSLTAFGAPSTRSLASFRPSPVSSRTTLMTWIFFSPAAPRMTSNSVFSSTAAAPPAAAPAAPGMAATAIGAAADTPHCSCSSLLSCDASSTVNLPSSSAICSMLAIASPLYLPSEGLRRAPALDGRATHAPAEFCLATTVETPPSCRRGLFRVLAPLRQDVHELALRPLQQADQLGPRALDGAAHLR